MLLLLCKLTGFCTQGPFCTWSFQGIKLQGSGVQWHTLMTKPSPLQIHLQKWHKHQNNINILKWKLKNKSSSVRMPTTYKENLWNTRQANVYCKHKTKNENAQARFMWSLSQRYCVNTTQHMYKSERYFSCPIDSHWYQCDGSASSVLEESP